ncbi:formate--tetrahydrofolate ligase [Klebsiella quasipneumoniae]
MPKSSPNVFTLCGFPAANGGEGFRETGKHSTVQCKKITNIVWQKHQTIN